MIPKRVQHVIASSKIQSGNLEGFACHYDGCHVEVERIRSPKRSESRDATVRVNDQLLSASCSIPVSIVELKGETGTHKLRIVNTRKRFRSLPIIDAARGDGLGVAINDIPVHHTLLDPTYVLRQSITGVQFYLVVLAINLLYGMLLATEHQAAWMAIQTIYGIPFFVVQRNLYNLKRRHLIVMRCIFAVAMMEMGAFLLDPLVLHTEAAVTNPLLFLVFFGFRCTALMLMLRGIQAARAVDKINLEIIQHLGDGAPIPIRASDAAISPEGPATAN